MGFWDALKKIVSQPTEFTPSSFQGYDRSYHYTDVMVIVVWQFGGKYGKTAAQTALRFLLQGERRGQHRVGVVSEKKNACAPFLNGPAGLLAANDLLCGFQALQRIRHGGCTSKIVMGVPTRI